MREEPIPRFFNRPKKEKNKAYAKVGQDNRQCLRQAIREISVGGGAGGREREGVSIAVEVLSASI